MSRAESLFGSAAFLILAHGTLAGLVPWLIRRWSDPLPLLAGTPPRLAGVLICLAGLVACFLRFAWQGRGAPAPIAPPKPWSSPASTGTCATQCTWRWSP